MSRIFYTTYSNNYISKPPQSDYSNLYYNLNELASIYAIFFNYFIFNTHITVVQISDVT